jgi:hypothetical protein
MTSGLGFEEFKERVRERLREILARCGVDFDHYERLSPHYSPAYVVYTCARTRGDVGPEAVDLAVAAMLFRYGIIAIDSAIDQEMEKDGVPTPYSLKGRRAVAEGLILIAEAMRIHPNFSLLLREMARGVLTSKEDVYLKTALPNEFTCREAGGDCEIAELWKHVGFVQQLYDDFVDGDDYSYYIDAACESWERVKDSPLSEYVERYRRVVEALCAARAREVARG